jgi:hypothetical protein
VRVTFDASFINPPYNHALSTKDLRQLYATGGCRVSRSHSNAIGITYAEIGLGLSKSTRTIQRERRGYCAYLEEVQADFGLDKFQVYIGREHSKGTCEYRTILDYENEHVSINNAIAKEYGACLRQSIEQRLSFMPPLFEPTGDNVARRALQELEQRIEPVV